MKAKEAECLFQFVEVIVEGSGDLDKCGLRELQADGKVDGPLLFYVVRTKDMFGFVVRCGQEKQWV